MVTSFRARTLKPHLEPSDHQSLVTFGGIVLTERLADNATTRDLAGQLPPTLTFKDFNKIGKLSRPLSMEGVPEGDDPDISDIGYYQRSGDLVFYCGDVGYWNGIARVVAASYSASVTRSPHSTSGTPVWWALSARAR